MMKVWFERNSRFLILNHALGRPISCSHPKREGFDEKMRICAILKGEIEDAPVVSKISCDFVVFRKKCWIITCF